MLQDLCSSSLRLRKTCLPPHHGRSKKTLVLLSSCCLLLSLLITPISAQQQTSNSSDPVEGGRGERLCSNTITSLNCTLGVTTFSETTGCCEPCTICHDHDKSVVVAACTLTSDTVCHCEPPTYLDDSQNQCALDCRLCPGTGECQEGVFLPQKCACSNQDCHLSDDIYCENPNYGPCAVTVNPNGNDTKNSQGNGGGSGSGSGS